MKHLGLTYSPVYPVAVWRCWACGAWARHNLDEDSRCWRCRAWSPDAAGVFGETGSVLLRWGMNAVESWAGPWFGPIGRAAEQPWHGEGTGDWGRWAGPAGDWHNGSRFQNWVESRAEQRKANHGA